MSIHVLRIFYNLLGDNMKLRIRDLREDRDLTQTELAKILGCTQQTYSRYESGEITIDIYNLVKLANFYNTSCDYLLGITDISKPYSISKKRAKATKMRRFYIFVSFFYFKK